MINNTMVHEPALRTEISHVEMSSSEQGLMVESAPIC